MADDKPLVLVVGATGAQGGGTVDALLRQGKYAVRGLTRNKEGDKAKRLASRGVDVVQGDLSDKASLVRAMSGAYAVFFVTDFHGTGASFDAEVQQGKNGIDAAVEAGVQHFIWSALEEVRDVPGLKEQLKENSPGHWMAHFESKGTVTEYLKTTSLQWTVLLTCMFFDNFAGLFPAYRQEDGTYELYNNSPPDAPIASHEVADIGRTVAAILEDPKKYAGQTLPVVSDIVTFKSIAATISEVTGKRLNYVQIPTEKLAQIDLTGAADIANMFEYYTSFPQYNDLRPLSKAIAKGPTFKEWAHDHQEDLTAHLN